MLFLPAVGPLFPAVVALFILGFWGPFPGCFLLCSFHVIHHVVLDQHPSRYSGSQASLPCFLRYHPMWPSLPKLLTLVQLELCSLHGVAASLHALHCASARSSTCCAWTWWSQHHTLPPSARCACRGCVSRGRLLWVVQSTTTLLVSSYHPPLQGRNLLSVSGLVSLLVSSTLW